MTTEATTDAEAESTETNTETTGTETAPDLAAEVEKWKQLSRKNEDKAKANQAAAKELEAFKAASMSEQEKAIEAAKAETRLSTIGEMGGKLAAAEIRVAAAGRLEPEQLSTLIDGLNLSSFLDENGDVDSAKVTAFVDGIAPAQQEEQNDTKRVLKTFDLGQGARGGQNDLQGDAFTRDLLKKVGGPR